MSLPHNTITKIPEQPEPEAVPSLWNTRYLEIDENFDALEQRTYALEIKVNELTPQSGTITLYNRGVIAGGGLTKSQGATRNLDLAETRFFLNGRIFHKAAKQNTVSIPLGDENEDKEAQIFLHLDEEGVAQCDCTPLGEIAPPDSVLIAVAFVPAGNNETNDPEMENVNIESAYRYEADWPTMQVNMPLVKIEIEGSDDVPIIFEYNVVSEVANVANGANVGQIVVTRNPNFPEFYLQLAGSADPVTVQWSIKKG